VNDFESLGLTVFPCSAVTGEGIESLRAAVTGRESVLAGLSGVGKSTLVNALVPGAEVLTRTVRMQDERGRHTTAATTVYPLPGGGVIIDTPGLRELGMDMAASELPWYFPDFDAYAPACRFNDCTHTVEPQCAVVAAVEAGKIQPRRYESYLRIRETLK
jgi:ribosome biogenesis GTPase